MASFFFYTARVCVWIIVRKKFDIHKKCFLRCTIVSKRNAVKILKKNLCRFKIRRRFGWTNLLVPIALPFLPIWSQAENAVRIVNSLVSTGRYYFFNFYFDATISLSDLIMSFLFLLPEIRSIPLLSHDACFFFVIDGWLVQRWIVDQSCKLELTAFLLLSSCSQVYDEFSSLEQCSSFSFTISSYLVFLVNSWLPRDV